MQQEMTKTLSSASRRFARDNGAGMAVGQTEIRYWGAAPEATVIGVKYGSGQRHHRRHRKRAHLDFLHCGFAQDALRGEHEHGLQEGPHDGTSLVDRAIDSLSGLSPQKGLSRIVVGAAGNDGEQGAYRLQACGRGDKGTLVWSEMNGTPRHERRQMARLFAC